MYWPLALAFIISSALPGHVYAQANKRPMAGMVLESPEMFGILKSILNRTVLKNDHTGSGTGVFIGTNKDNLGLVLTAGHVVRKSIMAQISAKYPRMTISEVDGIPRGSTNPESPMHLGDMFFSQYYNDSAEGAKRLGVPFYSPAIDQTQKGSPVVDDIWDDYALALVGQPAKGGLTVTEMFSNPSNTNPAPKLPPLKYASPVPGETLIVVGGMNTYSQERLLEAFNSGSKENILKEGPNVKAFYSVATVADYDKGWVATHGSWKEAPYDPTVEFFMEGDVADHGMSGGGVFNLKGELVGIVVFGAKHEKTSQITWVRAIRVDHIIHSIMTKSRNPDVLRSLKETGLGMNCNSMLH